MANIFKVLSAEDLHEIMEDNKYKLVLVMFSNKTCSPCKRIKPKFVNLAKEHPESLFIYVDLKNFKDSQKKYTEHVDSTPHFIFYVHHQYVYSILGANYQQLQKVTIELEADLKRKQEQARQYYQQQMMQNNKLPPISEQPENEQTSQEEKIIEQSSQDVQNNNEQTPQNDQMTNINNEQTPQNNQMINEDIEVNLDTINNAKTRQEKLLLTQKLHRMKNQERMNQINMINQLEYAKKMREQQEREQQILLNKMKNKNIKRM